MSDLDLDLVALEKLALAMSDTTGTAISLTPRQALALVRGARGGLHLSGVNFSRCVSVDGLNHPMASWSIAEWTNAVAGEAGEACNLAKKLIRFRDGIAGNNKPEDQDQESLRRRIAEELADVVIYCDLAMTAVGHDFATTVREVFNRKSREIGSPHLIPGPGIA